MSIEITNKMPIEITNAYLWKPTSFSIQYTFITFVIDFFATSQLNKKIVKMAHSCFAKEIM